MWRLLRLCLSLRLFLCPHAFVGLAFKSGRKRFSITWRFLFLPAHGCIGRAVISALSIGRWVKVTALLFLASILVLSLFKIRGRASRRASPPRQIQNLCKGIRCIRKGSFSSLPSRELLGGLIVGVRCGSSNHVVHLDHHLPDRSQLDHVAEFLE